MEQKQKASRRNGYIYSSDTRRGFLRLKRQGIPLPPFNLENQLTKALSGIYEKIITSIAVDFINSVSLSGGTFRSGLLTSDSKHKDIDKALSKADKVSSHRRESKIVNKSAVIAAIDRLKKEWNPSSQGISMDDEVTAIVDRILKKDTDIYMKNLIEDSPQDFVKIIQSFSLDKQQVFNDNIDNLRKLYLDDSHKRIMGEEDRLKRMFLQKLSDYAEGRSDTLDVEDIVKHMAETGVHESRFFARDQIQRFNKALTVSTYISAGVKTVRWCTCADQRVRESHRKLNGKIFDIDNLPKELDDYNCRCCVVPVDYGE